MAKTHNKLNYNKTKRIKKRCKQTKKQIKKQKKHLKRTKKGGAIQDVPPVGVFTRLKDASKGVASSVAASAATDTGHILDATGAVAHGVTGVAVGALHTLTHLMDQTTPLMEKAGAITINTAQTSINLVASAVNTAGVVVQGIDTLNSAGRVGLLTIQTILDGSEKMLTGKIYDIKALHDKYVTITNAYQLGRIKREYMNFIFNYTNMYTKSLSALLLTIKKYNTNSEAQVKKMIAHLGCIETSFIYKGNPTCNRKGEIEHIQSEIKRQNEIFINYITQLITQIKPNRVATISKIITFTGDQMNDNLLQISTEYIKNNNISNFIGDDNKIIPNTYEHHMSLINDLINKLKAMVEEKNATNLIVAKNKNATNTNKKRIIKERKDEIERMNKKLEEDIAKIKHDALVARTQTESQKAIDEAILKYPTVANDTATTNPNPAITNN